MTPLDRAIELARILSRITSDRWVKFLPHDAALRLGADEVVWLGGVRMRRIAEKRGAAWWELTWGRQAAVVRAERVS